MMKRVGLALVGAGLLVLGAVVPVVGGTEVLAAPGADICDKNNGIPDDLKEAAGCKLEKDETAVSAANNLIEVVLGLMGLIAVGVMVYGGVQYTISTGDSAKTTKAKHIITYGLVGLIVALLAYAIVRFVSGVVGG